MKKEILSFKIQRPKTRAHKPLFDRDLPFQPKVVNPKNQYKRRPKHRNGDWEEV
jgi:hypothetical protein